MAEGGFGSAFSFGCQWAAVGQLLISRKLFTQAEFQLPCAGFSLGRGWVIWASGRAGSQVGWTSIFGCLKDELG